MSAVDIVMSYAFGATYPRAFTVTKKGSSVETLRSTPGYRMTPELREIKALERAYRRGVFMMTPDQRAAKLDEIVNAKQRAVALLPDEYSLDESTVEVSVERDGVIEPGDPMLAKLDEMVGELNRQTEGSITEEESSVMVVDSSNGGLPSSQPSGTEDVLNLQSLLEIEPDEDESSIKHLLDTLISGSEVSLPIYKEPGAWSGFLSARHDTSDNASEWVRHFLKMYDDTKVNWKLKPTSISSRIDIFSNDRSQLNLHDVYVRMRFMSDVDFVLAVNVDYAGLIRLQEFLDLWKEGLRRQRPYNSKSFADLLENTSITFDVKRGQKLELKSLTLPSDVEGDDDIQEAIHGHLTDLMVDYPDLIDVMRRSSLAVLSSHPSLYKYVETRNKVMGITGHNNLLQAMQPPANLIVSLGELIQVSGLLEVKKGFLEFKHIEEDPLPVVSMSKFVPVMAVVFCMKDDRLVSYMQRASSAQGRTRSQFMSFPRISLDVFDFPLDARYNEEERIEYPGIDFVAQVLYARDIPSKLPSEDSEHIEEFFRKATDSLRWNDGIFKGALRTFRRFDGVTFNYNELSAE